MLLDSHTHRPAPYPQGVVQGTPKTEPLPGQLYSYGLHPWHIPADPAEALARLEEKLRTEGCVAVGEAGLDTLCSMPMWLQVKAFKVQIELSEALGLPLIVHAVRTAQEVLQMRRDAMARQPWIIHGFRGKPSVLAMYLKAGCHVSYGERFNTESLRLTPADRLLAETDESLRPIEEIIASLSEARCGDLLPDIIKNTADLFINKCI